MSAEAIRRVGVVGAGQMGRGIAQIAAAAGLEVVLCDAELARAAAGRDFVARQAARLVEKGKLAAADSEAMVARIAAHEGLDALEGVDIAIEAATEQLDIKLRLFREADAKLPAHAVLASNTSSISITRLAGATGRPDRVIGMHFMNPVPLMKLVEVVRGLPTSPSTHGLVVALAERLGKTVITSKDRPGFVVNRVLIPLLNEACFAAEEGVASPEDIDQGVRLGLNHPMGPLELADLIGLDTVLAIAEVLHGEFGDSKYRPATLLRNLVAAGWLGRKTGRGFYVYDERGQRIGPGSLG